MEGGKEREREKKIMNNEKIHEIIHEVFFSFVFNASSF